MNEARSASERGAAASLRTTPRKMRRAQPASLNSSASFAIGAHAGWGAWGLASRRSVPGRHSRPEKIKPESHAIDDLEIDSLDFLDIAFAVDKAFGIKLPLEQWTQEVNDGKASTDQYFVLKNLSARIDELVAAKGA